MEGVADKVNTTWLASASHNEQDVIAKSVAQLRLEFDTSCV